MDPISATEIMAYSSPFLGALLAGSKDKLKEIGKNLTGQTIDTLHGFWQRLIQVRSEVGDLARRSAAEPAAAEDLQRVIAQALEADPTLKSLAEELRPAIQVSQQSGGISQIAGKGSVLIGGNHVGSITLNNKGD